LVEYPGIEPGVVKTGGFTIHCITVDASTPINWFPYYDLYAPFDCTRTGVGHSVVFFEGIEFASNSASFIRYHFTCADKPGQVRGT